MKYTKKTLEELKKIVDRVAQISQEISGSDVYRNHLEARSQNNSLSEEERQAAGGLKDKIDLFGNLGPAAQNASSNIQKLINGNEQNLEELEREVDRFFATLQGNAEQITAAAESYFVWDDHDKTPEFNDPMWPVHKLAGELGDAVKSLDVLQMANGIHKYKEIDEHLQEEMTFLSAMSCDGINLTQALTEQHNAKARADEAENRFKELKDAREDWKRKHEDANRRIAGIPGEIQDLEDERRMADNSIKTAETDLQAVRKAHTEYDAIGREIAEAGRNAAQLGEDIEGLQQELSSKTQKTQKSNNTYSMSMEAYAHRAGGHAIDFFWPYVDSRERELRWTKVKELAGQLGDILWQDTTVLNRFLSRIENRSEKWSEQNQQGSEPRGMKPLSKENTERLDRIGELIAQMMRIAPDKSMLNDLLIPQAPVTDAGNFLDRLNDGLNELIDLNRKEVESNVLYQNTQRKKEEVSKKKEEYVKNADNLQKDNFGKKKEKKAKQKKNDNLAVEIAEQDKDMAIDAVNTTELDFLIEEHVNIAAEQAASDAKVDELKEKQSDILKRADELKQKRSDMCSDYETRYYAYLLDKQRGQGAEDSFFGDLENAISGAAEKDRNSRDIEIPQKIERLRNEQNEQRDKAEKYSLESYKKALVDAQIDAEKKGREYEHISAVNRRLEKAKGLFNDKTEELKRASSALDKEREAILDGIETFLGDFDRNKKTGHTNSDEYKAIKTALDSFREDAQQETTPERLKEMLGVLKQAASAYKERKNKQWFHWRPSGQRKFRLNQADNIERFCDAHTALIDSMGLDAATRQEIRDFSENPPADNMNAEQFRATAQGMKALYDNKISKFKNIMLEAKNAGAQRFDGDEQMTDEARKNLVINALVNNEVEKELWNTDGKQTFGRHMLDLDKVKTTAKENIEKNNAEFINKVIEDSKTHPEMSGADIVKRKSQLEAGRKYRDFTSYDQNLQQVLNNNAGNEMNRQANNNAVMNNDRAMVPQ